MAKHVYKFGEEQGLQGLGMTRAQLIQCAESLNRHARSCSGLIADFEESYSKQPHEHLANLINGYREDRRHIESTLAAVMAIING